MYIQYSPIRVSSTMAENHSSKTPPYSRIHYLLRSKPFNHTSPRHHLPLPIIGGRSGECASHTYSNQRHALSCFCTQNCHINGMPLLLHPEL